MIYHRCLNVIRFLGRGVIGAGWCLCLVLLGAQAVAETETIQTFPAAGVILDVKPDVDTVVIRHEAISNYMAAMTMPFKVKSSDMLAGWRRGDKVAFQLHVNATDSWIDHLLKTGSEVLPEETASAPVSTPPRSPLLDVNFTNELGQVVKLGSFRGQALAVTFFYTRCPLPDFCPRLSKNFEAASQKLAAMTQAPTNWHFISISFDSDFDSPAALKAYGESYHYDPTHWSFLTGPRDAVRALAEQSGLTYEADGAAFNHNFRTLIVDATGHLQHVFITGGDLSDDIVNEMLKATTVTNQSE